MTCSGCGIEFPKTIMRNSDRCPYCNVLLPPTISFVEKTLFIALIVGLTLSLILSLIWGV